MSIWLSKEIAKTIESEKLLSLNEGNTLLKEVYSQNGNQLFVKYDHKNPSGSWKDRGTAYLITKLQEKKVKHIVIASSGNAAISLSHYAHLIAETHIHIVVSPHINHQKKAKLQSYLEKNKNINLYFSPTAKKKRAELAAIHNAYVWSTSSSDEVLPGYWSLGLELYNHMRGNLHKSIYVIAATSSGAALVGLTQGIHQKIEHEHTFPKIIACQTQSCHPLIDDSLPNQEESLADSIVDKTMLRKLQVKKILERTNGQSMAITNNEILQAKQWLASNRVSELPVTSLLTIAAFLRLKESTTDSLFYCISSGM